MPGWYRACQIGRSEQQVHLQHFVAFGVQGTLLASVFMCLGHCRKGDGRWPTCNLFKSLF